MAQYTLAEAAKATGRSKSTILRSIRAGRISGARDELTGGWLVEPVELHRLYPERDAERGAANDRVRNGHDAPEIAELRVRLDAAEAAIRFRDETLADLRRRLDAEAEERRRLTAIIADQRGAVARPAPEAPASAWRRFLGWRR
jgi:hypothetical protein